MPAVKLTASEVKNFIENGDWLDSLFDALEELTDKMSPGGVNDTLTVSIENDLEEDDEPSEDN